MDRAASSSFLFSTIGTYIWFGVGSGAGTRQTIATHPLANTDVGFFFYRSRRIFGKRLPGIGGVFHIRPDWCPCRGSGSCYWVLASNVLMNGGEGRKIRLRRGLSGINILNRRKGRSIKDSQIRGILLRSHFLSLNPNSGMV